MLKSVLLAIMLEVCGGSKLILGDTEALEANGVGEASLEIRGHAVHIDLIVRALGSRKGGLDISKAEFHDVTRIVRVGDGAVVSTVETLCLEVLGDHLDAVSVSADEVKVCDSLVVNREETHGGTIFG